MKILYFLCVLFCLNSCHAAPSPDNTTIPPAASITDQLGDVWTLKNGVVYKNDVQDARTHDVALLIWYGGLVYSKNSSGKFQVLSLADFWFDCTDPRLPMKAKGENFYGINGHYFYPFKVSGIIKTLKDLGINHYRQNLVNNPRELGYVINSTKEFHAAGIKVLPVIDYQLHYGDGPLLYKDEQTAYNEMKTNLAAIATALGPLGVDTYECGNELMHDPNIQIIHGIPGSRPSDYNNTNWPIMRGLIRGMIDGVKSVQPTARTAVNFLYTSIAAADMLWEGKTPFLFQSSFLGMQPDGSTGHPRVRWDALSWHHYSGSGNIFNIHTDTKQTFNLPAYVKARYGTPFLLTEWNSAPSYTEVDRAAYVKEQMSMLYGARDQYGIETIMLYELFGSDPCEHCNYGITNSTTASPAEPTYGPYQSLIPIQPTYDTFKNFTRDNPDCLMSGKSCTQGTQCCSGFCFNGACN